ncbi:MAG: hypothetical protein WBO68_08385 [Pyrinomonadaceae bacterium]
MSVQIIGQSVDKSKIEISNSVGNGYSISLEPIGIEGFAGLQSFSAAQFEGKWLLIGGRTDGLHRRQPFASFSLSGNNTNIVVIDPQTKQSRTASIADLPPALNEQLQSTNMQSIQRGKTLYLIGGYGYSKSAGDHITHNKLTAVKVDCVVAAVQNGTTSAPCFRQIADPLFAVTGGQMGRIGDTYFLVGGQKFDGRYNPMGPDHGPGFSQEYTNKVTRFRIVDDGRTLIINSLVSATDKANLHRRDFNMLPQIFPDNSFGFTVFSGVFQVGANIPFTNTVDIYPTGHRVNDAFVQYLSHYHSAKVALYDASEKRMENIFFGGISQYEENAGTLTQNDDVPFTKVISKISRDKTGKMNETKLGEMPGFLGASAEFFVNSQLPMYENEIVKINEIKGDRILLGYIVGGISTTRKSIFFSNSGVESEANKIVFKVWLTKTGQKIVSDTKKGKSE